MAGGQELRGRHVLLGVSGGIAAYKAAFLARSLRKAGAEVQVVLTRAATAFVGAATFEGLTGRPAYSEVFTDVHEVLHVRLAREADVAVFAPATANLIGKFAGGLADDLASSIFTCLTCPVVVAPAMHTEMWQHPAVQANVDVLRRRGATIVEPGTGELAGGDVGPGRLAEEPDILAAITTAVARPQSALEGRRVVVTAGGTREPIDPVRFIGNRSSGKMGYALAEALARRGAAVELVTTALQLADPPGMAVHHVETAVEMRDAVLGLVDKADAVVAAAAVADWRPANNAAQKLKKTDPSSAAPLELVPNPDILAELGEQRGHRVLVGFAAETEGEEEHGRDKLQRKGLDLIVVNRVDAPDAGFAVDTNRALLLGVDGLRQELPLTSKRQMAEQICDALEGLLPGRQ